jgi:thiamine-monophosphate kinase
MDSFLDQINLSHGTVADAGEDGILEMVERIFPQNLLRPAGVSIPTFGDDAAVLGSSLLLPDEELVITSDVLVEGADFLFDWMSYFDLGYKSLMVNLSDLAAMGSDPLGMVVVVGLPDKTPLVQLESFLQGLKHVAVEYNTILLGGDLSECDKFFCNITLLGRIPQGKSLTRGNAVEGDCLCVTGYPGEARAGLMIAMNRIHNARSEEKVFLNPFFRPQARISVGRILRDLGYIRGCLDLSDGIARDSCRISKRNNARIEIDASELPVTEILVNFWKNRGHDPYREIVTGGEDFELMFCCPKENFKYVENSIKKETGLKVTMIGKIMEGEGSFLVMPDGSILQIHSWGFDHFSK